jgi:diguanylate cyclase (GGDEF)-like protein
MIDTTVDKIMHRHVITVDANASARECAHLITQERIGCVIVTDAGEPVGIVTERSFAHLLKRGRVDSNKILVRDFMVTPIIAVGPKTSGAEAFKVFRKKNIKRLPVVSKGTVVGLLTLHNMIEYSRLAMATMDKKQQRLETEVMTDAMTGLFNKKAITDRIVQEHERLQRYGGRAAILFVDLDFFKKVNDTYGHDAGDAVLIAAATLLQNTCRHIDVVGRYGGEEFVILAPNRKKRRAINFALRLCREIESYPFSHNGSSIPLTTSIGVADLLAGESHEDAIKRADQALYHAKQSGRNCVGMWRDDTLTIAEELGAYSERKADANQ